MVDTLIVGIFIMVVVLLVIFGMTGWVGAQGSQLQNRQSLAVYCKDWITSGCAADAAINKQGMSTLRETCAAAIGKSPEQFPDMVKPEDDWNKCRSRCPGCPLK